MCLITMQKEPTVLAEDLVVWKEVDGFDHRGRKLVGRLLPGRKVVKSPYHSFYYTSGETYKTKIEQDKNDTCTYDQTARDAIESILPEKYAGPFIYGDSTSHAVKDGYIMSYGQGFHFATTRDRIKPLDGSIVERFVVPAGSEVYFDNTGLGIASAIRYEPENEEDEK